LDYIQPIQKPHTMAQINARAMQTNAIISQY
jgi:hypothetical protein